MKIAEYMRRYGDLRPGVPDPDEVLKYLQPKPLLIPYQTLRGAELLTTQLGGQPGDFRRELERVYLVRYADNGLYVSLQKY